MSQWLRSLRLKPQKKRQPFPLLALPTEAIVTILRHVLLFKFKHFRNTLIALPELNELVICLTNCPEAALSILPGVQCVTQDDYVRLMSCQATKKPLPIMILSPYLPHRGEQPRSLDAHPFLGSFYQHISDTVVAKFVSPDPATHRFLRSHPSYLEPPFLYDQTFEWIDKFPSLCSCTQPLAFPAKATKMNDTNYSLEELMYGDQPGVTRLVRKVHEEVEQLWIARMQRFPYKFPWYSSECFPQLRHLYLDFKDLTRSIDCACGIQRCWAIFEAPVLETLAISFWTLQIPLIQDFTSTKSSKIPLSRELVVHNMYWSSIRPRGSQGWQKGGDGLLNPHDQYRCSTEHLFAYDQGKQEHISFMFESYVFIGVPDKFLMYPRWECVKSLYWKRLEPVYARPDMNPSTIHCPLLKELKIYHVVDDKVALIKFDVPVLEQLVLVSLPGSTMEWDVFKLLDHRWPETLCKFTISPYQSTAEPSPISMSRTVGPTPMLTHLWIQRTDITPCLSDVVFGHLVYLDVDVTVVPVTNVGVNSTTVSLPFSESNFPSLQTLILSMPQMSNKLNRDTRPISVQLPKTCCCVGVATMLGLRRITVDGQVLQAPWKFTQKPLMEVCTRYVKQPDGLFVDDGEMMAGHGESLDLLMESQRSGFDHEKRLTMKPYRVI